MPSQSGIHPDLGAQLLGLFQDPDPAAVPSGVLAWFGSTQFPDGVADIATLDLNDWCGVYTRIESSVIMAGVVPPLQTLLAQRKAWRPDGPVHIAITHVKLARTTADFQEQVLRAARSGTALDRAPESLAAVIEPATAFAVAGLVREQFGRPLPPVRGRTVTFTIERTLYSTNAGGPLPDSMEIDIGGGAGFRAITWGEEVAATYAADGPVVIAVRCHYGSAVREGRAKIVISSDAAAPEPDETWPLDGAPSGATGSAYVFHGSGHTQVMHPIIVAEGFPGGYAPDYLHDALSGHGLLPTLLGRGFDLVVVSYDGTLPIQRNAEVVEACIMAVLRRVGTAGGAAPLIVGGVSMGGIVSRYALASMESRGVHHGARIFFTVDSPHGGAYTNVADQWLLHLLSPASSLARTLSWLMDCESNQQFLALWVKGGEAIVSGLRTAFLADLAKVGGHPMKPRRIAVANGRGDGRRSLAAAAPMLTWSGSPFGFAELRSLPESDEPQTIASGWCLRADPATSKELRASSKVSWEGAPGGSNDYNLMAAVVAGGLGLGQVEDFAPILTAVSTLSALDIDPAKYDAFSPVPAPGSGASPFQDYLCGTENTRHISITAESSVWLAAQFGFPPVSETT